MNKLIKISVLCLLVNIVFVFGDSCGNGATCMVLSECKGLLEEIQRVHGVGEQREVEFLRFLRSLRCDSSNRNLMVCCPPELRYSTIPAESLRIDDVTQPELYLLPNSSVCGIQYKTLLYGSDRADFDEYPWIALIRYDKPRDHGFHCGGVLISSRYVLTAAHCVTGPDIPSSWTVSQVRLGEWNTTSEVDCNEIECAPPAIDVDVEEVIPHSQYRPHDVHQRNDIALLRLARDVPFSDFVRPICLPHNATLVDSILQGGTTDISGWGISIFRPTSEIKLKATLPVVEQSLCQDVYSRVWKTITNTQLCAGGNDGQNSCRGDSGGPLMTGNPPLSNWVVVGIKSYGARPCGVRYWPGVYTRVISYMEWIIDNMRP